MLKSLTEKTLGLAKSFFGGTKKDDGSAKRKGDFIMIVCQRNDQKRLEIQAVDSEMESVTGFGGEYLTRRTLNEILPAAINETINNYLEFDDYGNDLAAVLSKVRDFAILSKEGKEIPVSLKIMHTTALDKNPRFCLVMREVGLLKALGASRDQIFKDLSENQIIDDAVGLISINSFMKNLELISFFIERTSAKASFAIISVDNFRDIDLSYGSAVGNKIIHDVGMGCKSTLRDEDIVGYLGANKVGAILFDSDADTSNIPLNRIRWMLNSRTLKYDNTKPIKITVTISYTTIKKGEKPEEIVERCEEGLRSVGNQEAKDLIQV